MPFRGRPVRPAEIAPIISSTFCVFPSGHSRNTSSVRLLAFFARLHFVVSTSQYHTKRRGTTQLKIADLQILHKSPNRQLLDTISLINKVGKPGKYIYSYFAPIYPFIIFIAIWNKQLSSISIFKSFKMRLIWLPSTHQQSLFLFFYFA